MADEIRIAHLMSPAIAIALITLGAICYAAAWWLGRAPSPYPLAQEERENNTPSPPTLTSIPGVGNETPLASDNEAANDDTSLSPQSSVLITPRRTQHYERDVLAVGAIVLAIIGFFWQPLFQNNVWLPRGGGDFTSFYYPLYSFAANSLQAGDFPFWNPTLYAGMPYAADIQTAALYPPTLLMLLLGNFSYAKLEWLVIFHYMLAGAFMYAFLRVGFGLHRAACIIGGLAFACSGFMTAHFGHVPMVPVASWLPLAMLGAKLATERDSLRWAAVAAVALAMSALAGHAQIFFYVALIVALWWLWLLFVSYQQNSPPRNRERAGERVRGSEVLRLIIPPITAAFIFVLIAALQLTLSGELGSNSVRAGISYQQAATDFTTQPIGLLWLILPHVWGSNPQSYWSLGNWASTETWAYSGIITLVLAALAFIGKPSPPAPPPIQGEGSSNTLLSTQHSALSTEAARWFFAAVAVISLLLTLGGGVILFGWLFALVPEWDKFRSVGRLLLPFGFALSTLAAFGAARLFAWAAERRAAKMLRRITYVLLAIIAAIAGIALPIFLARVTEGTNIERSVPFVNDLLLLLLWLGAMAALLWYARHLARTRQGNGWLVTLLLATFILDLFSVNAAFNPTTTDNTVGFDHPAAVQFLQSDHETYRLDSDTGIGDVWQPSLAARYNLQDASGIYNPLKPARYDQLFQKARLDRNSNLYGMLNIKYVVGLTDTRTLVGQGWMEDMQLQPVFSETHGVTIYRNLNALPRAYVIHRSVIELDTGKLFALVSGPNFNPRKAVALEAGEPLAGTLPSSARYAETNGANPDTSETATIISYGANRVELTATLKQDGYLVLTDVYYPGWKVTVDDQPADLLRANYAFRAVRLTAGKHSVSFSLTPRLWWPGLAAMLFGLLAAVALIIFGHKIKLRHNPQP